MQISNLVDLLASAAAALPSAFAASAVALLTVLLLGPSQTAAAPDIVLFDNNDGPCSLQSPYEMCRDLAQTACCHGFGHLWTCAYLDSDGQEVLHAYSTQFGDHCRIPIESALANICICPTGTIVISGARWNYQSSGKHDINRRGVADFGGADEPCTETMTPNAVGVHVNGTRFVVSKAADPAGFALVHEMLAKGSDKAAITEWIVNIGAAE